MTLRIGHGFDVHQLTEGDGLALGGVRIPCDYRFVAHSDGDVLIHALCDALLGALALGDIGQHFPDTDERYRGVESSLLLAEVWRLVIAEGYGLGNIDITVVAQKPRLSSHVPAMRQSLSQVFQSPESLISIKATTTEGLGYVGRGEGIAVHAVVLLESLK